MDARVGMVVRQIGMVFVAQVELVIVREEIALMENLEHRVSPEHFQQKCEAVLRLGNA
ncbi:MAG: hypothetical protein J0H18_14465 [Rhizobiales bacterium]|nr:hypothetical protein [Hyphomicrobiales bacterium]